MKKLGAGAYSEIRAWVYRNARPLDLSLWQFYFEDGSREDVIHKLSVYQNEDGGFGNGLDPDCWNPDSSPYGVMTACMILRGIGLEDAGHPMIQGILRYLECTPHRSEEGWFFCIPSNDGWPRAPWWTYSQEVNAVEGTGVTASLCAFILHFGDRQSAVYATALRYTDMLLKKAADTEDFGEMGAAGLGMMLMEIEKCGLASRFDCSELKGMLMEVVNRSMERNPEMWESYTHRPSEFIWSRECPFYHGNEEIVEKELDYMIDTRIPGGVWDITWTWFELGERFVKGFAVSENWYKTKIAIEKIHFFRAFDRM